MYIYNLIKTNKITIRRKNKKKETTYMNKQYTLTNLYKYEYYTRIDF